MRRNCLSCQFIIAVLTLLLMTGFLSAIPGQALGADSFTVTSINISKQYSSIEIPDVYYLTITGTNLGETTVSYLDSGGQLITLANPTGGDGIQQYTIDPEKIGITLFIDGPGGTRQFNIAETNMSRITSLNPKAIKAGDILNIAVANRDKLDGTEYQAFYYDQINDVEISSQLHNGTPITVNTTGLYNIRFERNFTDGPDSTPINISYRYLNIFRVYDDLDGVSPAGSISMFPNRGEKGSTIYFRADQLKPDMSVFFLKKDDGTDSFTQANKGTNYSYYKDAEGNVDIATVKVPSGLTTGEEYFVYFTNQISDAVDPMKYIFKQLKLTQKFTVINVSDKVQVFNITPNSGPDTGQNIEIMGRYLGTLNITGLTANSPMTDASIGFTPDLLQAVINYGDGNYSGEAVTGITKRIRVNIANSAGFQIDRTQKAANFSLAADRIYVKTPTFPITDDKETTYPVEIRTTTTFSKGGFTYTFEEFTSYTGFTFIPSMSQPVVESTTPDKIQIEESAIPDYKVKNDTLLAVYGQNFKIYRETAVDGSTIIRYPIVRILNGESLETEINMNTGKVLDKSGNPVKDQNGNDVLAEMYIFDASGNLLDGSAGKQTGAKILVKIPRGTAVNIMDSASSPRSVRVVNPIKNGDGEGLYSTLTDKLHFVMTDQNPVISSLAPDVVTVQGGEDVTIKGGNFRNGVKVIIDGKEVSSITRDGAGETITFTAPPGRAGVTQLLVLNPEGGTAIWPFTYVTTYTDPKLISFSPVSGNTGTLVVVKGENFMAPDPTAIAGEIYKLIGTRILLGNQEINEYNRNEYNQIILQPYSNAADPVIDDNGYLASYYYSVVFEDESVHKYYVLQQEPDGTVRLTGGTDNNTYVITVQNGSLIGTKVNGGDYALTVQAGTLTINGLTLAMKTPYKIDSGKNQISGNYGQVISSSEVRFVVPILTADGYYDVTVVNPDTKRASKTGNQGFYYYGHPYTKPEITGISPQEGSTAGGYTIEINGSDFQDNGTQKTAVSINGVDVAAAATTVSVDGTKITVVVPPYPGDLWKDKSVGRLTVPVVIVNPDGASASKEDGFTYVVPSSYPKITKIVPDAGSAAGGDIVEITGQDFRFFEPFEDKDRDQTLDQDEPYSDLNKNNNWDTLGGSTAAQLKALYGDNYDAIVTPVLPKVYFGSKQSVIQEFANGYLKVLAPAGAAGKVDVYVVNNDSGISNRVQYTYQASNPKIDKIVPDQGKKQGKDNIEIYGSGFFENQITVYDSQTTFDTVTMPLIRFGSITNSTIPREQANSGRIDNGRTTVNLDGGLKVEYDAGAGQVTVEITENKQVYRGIFDYDGSIRYIDVGLLSNISDTTQKYYGYELLRLEVNDRRLLVERGYTPSASLALNTELTLKTPSYYAVGTVTVTVINPDGGMATGQFEYKNPDSHPVIINMTKDGNSPVTETYQGSTVKIVRLTYKGGNIVSIIGQDFREKASVQISNLVKIEPSAITYSLPSRLTFTMPAVDKSQINKLHRVMVINEDGASGASDQAIPPIYIEFIEGTTAPQISKLTPDTGPAAGGTSVKIEGADFRSGLNVYFGETPVAVGNITFIDYKTIQVVTPANSPGKVGVKVENPDGELSAPVDFTYLSCPQITAVVDPTDPTENTRITSISVEGGQEIKIKGSGFMDGGRVIFNPVIKKAENDSDTGSDVIYLAGVPYTL
ncbi:MAG TPA: IPT/TIG domain-containing protein, partial [Syntrophomonadaceae bacterium]|nr:IPT/TIG domain-containing protein [Syntrophomonadaceae bacterium]